VLAVLLPALTFLHLAEAQLDRRFLLPHAHALVDFWRGLAVFRSLGAGTWRCPAAQ
jgi:hypothetical protein